MRARSFKIGPSSEFELGVDHYDVFVVVNRIDNHGGAGFDRSGHFDDDVNILTCCQQIRVFHQNGNSGRNRPFGVLNRRYADPAVDIGLAKNALRICRRPVGDRDQANARRRGSELEGDGAACRSSANHTHADRSPRGLALTQECIDSHLSLPLESIA